MTRRLITLAVTGVAAALILAISQQGTSMAAGSGAAKATRLIGKTGGSLEDFSSYLDLVPAKSFSRGNRIVITVEGPAKHVMVRLLPKGFNPNKSDVVAAERLAVKSGMLEVTLTSDYKDITQVSIHSGPKPFGIFDLGAGNGYAAITKVEHVED
jgi:hypothetical protein